MFWVSGDPPRRGHRYVGKLLAQNSRVRWLTLGFSLVALGNLRSGVGPFIQCTVSGAATRPPTVSRRAEGGPQAVSPNTILTKHARFVFIERAQVWTKTDVSRMNLRIGPGGPGGFQPNEMVVCDYVEMRMHGATRKFHCAIHAGDVVKVRYGAHNGEVEGSVLATRLLWALGFVADSVYPVRVTCRGCASDPWNHRAPVSGEQVCDPAVIERKPPGYEMRESDDRKAGWAWGELDLVDESLGGASVQQRDALKLLAVFMQHTDSKPQQQRLLCAGGLTGAGACDQPFLFLHDVGLTFGRAQFFHSNRPTSVNLDGWSRTSIWRDRDRCIGDLSRSHNGTLANPHISEAGRSFLANLLVQLTDRQLRDLFEVAGVDRRSVSRSPASLDDSIAAFNHKRTEIVTTHCPA